MSNNNHNNTNGKPTSTYYADHTRQRFYTTNAHDNASVAYGDFFGGRAGFGNGAPILVTRSIQTTPTTTPHLGHTHTRIIPPPRTTVPPQARSGKATFNPWAKYYPNASANASKGRVKRTAPKKTGPASANTPTSVPEEDDGDSDFVDTDSESLSGDESHRVPEASQNQPSSE